MVGLGLIGVEIKGCQMRKKTGARLGLNRTKRGRLVGVEHNRASEKDGLISFQSQFQSPIKFEEGFSTSLVLGQQEI